MGKVRVKISSLSISETEVHPAWNAEFLRKIEKGRVYYSHEMRDNMTFTGVDFTLINGLTNECEKITMTVERFCSGDWQLYWTGFFTKFDCKPDFFRCRMDAKVKPDNLYECLFEQWETEQTVYAETGVEVPVRSLGGTYQGGLNFCQVCRATADLTPCDTYDDGCIEPGYPKVYAYPSPICPEPNRFEIHTYWHREVGTGTLTEPPPWASGWTHLTGTTWWRCPDPDTADLEIGVLKWGRRFDLVLEKMFAEVDCEITLRSHFFNINATHAAPPDNDAYDYAVAAYQDMTVHQKSDVKRPHGDKSFEFVWKMKLKTLLEDLQNIFNVYWKLDGSDLILEHISYFEGAEGEDYSLKTMPLSLEYEPNTARTERFFWSDEDCNSHFRGKPIVYSCGEGESTRRVSLFSTDVQFIHNESFQDSISDANFVLISNVVNDGVYFIIDKNSPLGWTTLHDKLHRHYRLFGSGTMNGVLETFLSVIPIKKQPEFTVTYCCDNDTDPLKYVTTPLGIGHVQTQTENLYKDTLKIQLNYE